LFDKDCTRFVVACQVKSWEFVNVLDFHNVNHYNIVIMIKDNVIILLIALTCVSPMSGLFTVICYGNDGHIAVEPIGHDHCDCPESEGGSGQKASSEAGIGFSCNHSHCKDSPANSNVVLSVRKNIKPQLAKVFVQSVYQKSISDHRTSSFRYSLLWNTELSSFFTPLRTIILLA